MKMMKLNYLWNKIVKKARGSSIKNSIIHSTSKVESGSLVVNSVFEKYSFCGYDCKIIDCSVGSFTSIADNVVIGGGRHPMEWVGMSPVFYEGRDSVKKKFSIHSRQANLHSSIGNDVWIGESALIRAGVRIGHGAVIGMGSVVTKDVDNYAIVAGNPARLIRYRFPEETISSLLKLKWWDFDEKKLEVLSKYIQNPDEFIRAAEE